MGRVSGPPAVGFALPVAFLFERVLLTLATVAVPVRALRILTVVVWFIADFVATAAALFSAFHAVPHDRHAELGCADHCFRALVMYLARYG